MKKWTDRFLDPPVEYRPIPFWSWNDKLEKEELKRQITEMAKVGEGGFFMHARDGLTTPYMEDEWFDLVRACAEKSKEEGVHAWCYDELGWPSGSAGGAVTGLGDKYCVRWLRIRECINDETAGEVIAFYGINGTSYRYLGDTYDDAAPLLAENEKLMYATQFTDDSYFDILNPEVVKAFIDSTYEKYNVEARGELNGGALKGFFTDEPQYALCRTPWSTITLSEFEKTYGYSLKEHIPALLLGRDGYEKIRYDFWKMVNRLFTESFAGQIYDWCENHSCQLTGHAMMEDNLICQIHCTAGCMPMYEHMHIPGIDWLGRHTAHDRISDDMGSPLVPLQVGSVASQLGKKHVLTETYAMSGWDISFAEMRHLVEWQFLGGVNLVCQHLEPYSLRGHRKNDYPPAMFYQSPWWSEYKAYVDTVSRLGMMLAEGEDDPDVLMIHPMHSIWLKYTNDDMNAEGEFDNLFCNTVMKVAQAHLPFHLGDETIIARHGSVQNGKFIIGKRSYSTVFIPNIWGLDRTTYDLLLKFSNEGGRIVLLGDAPEFIDGLRAEDEIAILTEKCDKIHLSDKDAGFEDLLKYISENNLPRLPVTGNNGEERHIRVAVRHFNDSGKTMYFLLNTDTKPYKVTLTLNGSEVAEYLPENGNTAAVKHFTRDNKTFVELGFAPLASHVIFEGEGVSEGALPEKAALSLEIPLDPTLSEWKIGADSDKNCYLLDTLSIGNGEKWSDKTHAMRSAKLLREFENGDTAPQAKYSFTIDENADLSAMSDMKFVTEVVLPVTVYINGRKAKLLEGEWWLDHTFSVFAVGDLLKHGENEIVLTNFCTKKKTENGEKYVPNSPFTFGYLTGSFGVFSSSAFIDVDLGAMVTDGPFYLSDMPESIFGGNIVDKGFPFFRGKICLEKNIEIPHCNIPMHISLEGMKAVCGRINVNGSLSDLAAWGHKHVDVTGAVKEGTNQISVELIIGNRNLLGPHHKPVAGTVYTGPSDFEPSYDIDRWKPRYAFARAGLGE